MFTAVAVAVVVTVGANPRSPFYQLVKNELISVVALTEMSDISFHFVQQFLSCQQSYNDFFYSVRVGNFQSFDGGFKSVLFFSEVHAICLNCEW